MKKKHELWVITEYERLHVINPNWTKQQMAKTLCISVSTLYRILRDDFRKVQRGQGDTL